MSSKKNTRILIYVFIVLLVLVGVNKIVKNSKGESTFDAEPIEFKAEEVKSMSLYTQMTAYEEIKLIKEEEEWMIHFGDNTYRADYDLVNGMINELANLRAIGVVAQDKKLWGDYDVTDTTGTRVVVYDDNSELEEVYIGRFSYNQQTRKPKTFVRLAGDKNVYTVEGYLSMTFGRDVNGLRNKSIFRANRNDLNRLNYTYPADSSFSLMKQDITWLIDGMPTDSTNTINYLNNITYLVGIDFRDNFSPTQHTGPTAALTIERNDMPSVEIKAFITDNDTIITSSENRDTYFATGAGNLYNTIFKGPSHFRMKQ